MSDSITLIIEIPKIDKELLDAELCGETRKEAILHAVKNGTPLDSVKEKILQLDVDCDYREEWEMNVDIHTVCREEVLWILDNIGKAASEDKE